MASRTLADNVPVPLRTLNQLRLPTSHTLSIPGRHLRLVTSGQPGSPGQWGTSGSFGSPGGHGLPGQRGADAAPITLSLRVEDNLILAHYAFNGQRPSEAPLQISDSSAAIFLEAAGGHGGRGGDGGRGGNGMAGAPGTDATRYSAGTSGGRGQNGGNGGDGGRGGDGGHGAGVSVFVQEVDMDLLILIKSPPHALGGIGGEGGSGGSGGMGGPGGRGGSAYHWTESHTVYYDGRSQTTYHSRSQPGGMSGMPGSSGMNGADGLAGSAGADGIVTFSVGGLGEFGWRYDLQVCEGVVVQDDLGAGVLQPGARILMEYAVHNCGGMPTPTAQDIVMSIKKGRWARPLQREDDLGTGTVALPRSIPMAHIVPLPQPIHIMLKEIVAPVVGDPFNIQTNLRHRAVVSRINQTMPLVSDQATVISMTFPLHMSHFFGNVCVLRGSEAFVAWKVANISNMNIGSQAPLPRNARSRFLAIKPEHRVVVDDRNCTISSMMTEMGHLAESRELSPLDFVIGTCTPATGQISYAQPAHEVDLQLPFIEAGAEVYFVCAVRVVSGDQDLQEDNGLSGLQYCQTHSQACLASYLDLGHPQSLLDLKSVQVRPFQVQLAEQFVFRAGETKALIVVNNRTTPQEITQWRTLIAGLMNTSPETGIALWNISLYGGFSFKYKVSVSPKVSPKDSQSEQKQPLGSLFCGEDSLAIILNNSCTPMAFRKDTAEHFPMQVLRRHEVLHACKNYRCNVYIAGSSKGAELRSRMRIPVDAKKLVEFVDTDEFLKHGFSTLYPNRRQNEHSQRSTDATASPAWMYSDLKGALYKHKQSGRGRVRRIFCLRKERGQLLYYRKVNSRNPSGIFQLADCSVVISESKDIADHDSHSDSEPEILVLQTPERQLKLQPVITKGNTLDPSLAEWRAEIEDGIISSRNMARNVLMEDDLSSSAVKNLDVNSSESNPEFDGNIPEGFDRYCAVKVITRQVNVRERMLSKKAEEFAQSLAQQNPEYPCLVVYKYVEKSEQDHNRGAVFNKRNIGDLFVHLGLPRGHGQVVSKCSGPNGDKAWSNSFVHKKVLSDRNKYGILKILPIATKLRLLRDAGQHGTLNSGVDRQSISLDLLVNAILSDAADEHAMFRFGSVSAASKIKQTLMPSKKRSDAEEWARRLVCLVAISNEGTIGAVTPGSEKFKEVFRLCAVLRMLVKCSVPMTQRVLKVSRAGLIARASDGLLNKLEGNFATALGLQDAKELQDEHGQTVEQRATDMMKHGLIESEKKITYSDLLSFLRGRFDLGIEGANEEGGLFKPIVIPYEEFASAKKWDRRAPTPVISMTPGVFESTAERQQALSSFLRNWASDRKPPIVRL